MATERLTLAQKIDAARASVYRIDKIIEARDAGEADVVASEVGEDRFMYAKYSELQQERNRRQVRLNTLVCGSTIRHVRL